METLVKQLMLVFLLITLPTSALAVEQNYTQQGLKASIKLSPERPKLQAPVQLTLGLSKDGASITDKDVTLEVYAQSVEQPFIKRQVEVLDGEYVDSWKFENAGDYKVVITIADHQKPDEIIRYEVKATVNDADGDHGEPGFFSHHFGGSGMGWWGAGFMLLMMVPMMILL